jgi:hypothetical protein
MTNTEPVSIPLEGGLQLVVPAGKLADEVIRRLLNGDALAPSATVAPLKGVPPLGADWPGQGGFYAGVVRGADGKPDHHLILADPDKGNIKWDEAMKWAKGLKIDVHEDYALPERNEQAILYGNVPERFEKQAYWSAAPYAGTVSSAWYQHFDNGNQNNNHKANKLRARAVRRLPIQ